MIKVYYYTSYVIVLLIRLSDPSSRLISLELVA